ncbi:hypothetical protein [Carnobacterium mobile]|uniref:hypothetical protein n=1 Tax=Carnobacterium mobile TaxID=2750 RepID=UPI0005541FA3|nr:hypothetical protein [Carnobacterium mobile]
MKNKFKLILFVVVIIIIVSSLYITSKDLLVNLITKNETTGEIEYVSIYSNGSSKETDVFKSEDFKLYNADSTSFSSYISNGKVLNKVNKIMLKDSSGNVVDNDEIITGIFHSAEKIEHDIWEFQIFKVLDDYFVLVKLNVNWQSPCNFYEYDIADKELKLLHKFQDIDVIGLSLPS